MSEISNIRDRIPRDIFDYQSLVDCLSAYRKPRDRIERLVKDGDIVRIRRGLYTFETPFRRQPIVREQLANQIYGPSYVSLESALSFHGLIPEQVTAITSVTTGRSREFETPLGRFSYRMLTPARYAVGAMLLPENEPSFLMAAPEKALADKVWTDKRFLGTRAKDVEPYLVEDLRIAPEALRSLDAARLKAIRDAYDSPKIAKLIDFLRRMAKGGLAHA